MTPEEIRLQCIICANGDLAQARAFAAFVFDKTPPATSETAPVVAPETKTTKPKAEKVKVEEPAPDLAAPEEPEAQAVTYKQVQETVVGLAKAKGRQAVLDVFAKFDVDHATKLSEDQWPAFIAAAQEAVG